MANITENEALAVVSVADMKEALRVPATESSHDALLTRQIHDAANYVMQATGVPLAELGPLRAAIVSLTRELYDGRHELSPDSAVFALLAPFRSYEAG